jgi:hypothetical protein
MDVTASIGKSSLRPRRAAFAEIRGNPAPRRRCRLRGVTPNVQNMHVLDVTDAKNALPRGSQPLQHC